MDNFIKRLRKGNIAVLCDTHAEAEAFLERLSQEEDIAWRTGVRPKNFNPHGFYDDTCFEIVKDNVLVYCEESYYIDNDYEIVNYNDIKEEI